MAATYLTLKPKTQKVAHAWKTGLQTTVTGIEKRSMLFTWPRINLENEFLATTNQQINYLKRNIFYYADQLWGIPIWADLTTLTAQAASGQKNINVVQTANRHFYAGRKCIIIDADDFTRYEVATINTLSAVQLVSLANLTITWPVGSLVLPCYDCYIAQDQEIGADYQRGQSFVLQASEAYESLRTFTYSAPVSGAATYEGLDLFAFKFLRPLAYHYKRSYELSQFLGLGFRYGKYAAGDNTLGLRGKVIRETRQEIWDLINFFDSKAGRLTQFWVPTWSKDLVATAAIGAGDTVINTEPIQYSTHYLPNDIINRYVFIEFPDKTTTCRKISNAATSTITLDSAIGKAVAAGDLTNLLISFLIQCRFDIDELEIDFTTATLGQAELSFAGLVGEAL